MYWYLFYVPKFYFNPFTIFFLFIICNSFYFFLFKMVLHRLYFRFILVFNNLFLFHFLFSLNNTTKNPKQTLLLNRVKREEKKVVHHFFSPPPLPPPPQEPQVALLPITWPWKSDPPAWLSLYYLSLFGVRVVCSCGSDSRSASEPVSRWAVESVNQSRRARFTWDFSRHGSPGGRCSCRACCSCCRSATPSSSSPPPSAPSPPSSSPTPTHPPLGTRLVRLRRRDSPRRVRLR